MELLNKFKKSLTENDGNASKITVKNYIADVKKFILWYESTQKRAFSPTVIPQELVKLYFSPIIDKAPRSAKRYTSSLRKFFAFLNQQNIITFNPLELSQTQSIAEDLWHIKDFDNYLFSSNASSLTRKNYLNDVNQFTNWMNHDIGTDPAAISNQDNLFANITLYQVEKYKNILLNEAHLSPISVNRKLSSLRKYFSFARKKGLLKLNENTIESIPVENNSNPLPNQAGENLQPHTLQDLRGLYATNPTTVDSQDKKLSKFAPIRFFQKINKGINLLFDSLIILSIIKAIEAAKYNLWKSTGKQVFQPLPKIINSASAVASSPVIANTSANLVDKFIRTGISAKIEKVHGLPKSVYAPSKLSLKSLPVLKKLIYHLKYSRPNWYKKYHNISTVHYIHFGIILLFATFLGFSVFQALKGSGSQSAVLSSKLVSARRLIAFQGTLRDADGTPITKQGAIRFGIYKSPIASGSALLWQEVQTLTPDAAGNFKTSLGKINQIEQDLFVNNPNLFLGITIGTDKELSPRQQLANTTLTQNSQELQGLKPITGNNAQTENVILALDSSGNLTIGGSSSPIFQALGGEFKLSGQQLTLATNEGSNTNIVLSPDGTGIIDVQKPLQNTSDNNNSPDALGAVEIDDNLAILASSSAQSALIINQNATGDLISANTGGSAKFSVSNSGSVRIAEDLSVLGNNFVTSTSSFSLANTNTTILNIGGAATSISLGAPTGTTTINHGFDVNGIIKAKGGIALPNFTQGTIPFIGPDNKIASDSANLFWDNTNKRLGIGTQTPSFRLDAQDIQSSGAVAQIYNTATSANTIGLNLRLGITGPAQAGNRWINFMDGNGAVLGKIRGNNSSSTITFDSNGGDFAEYFLKADPGELIQPGDLICYSSVQGVEKCKASSNGILGVFSDNAGFVGAGGHENDPKYVLVGLIGQLNLKISPNSEAIKPGDPITFSKENGHGTKAVKAGQIIGRSLEAYDPAINSKSIKISLNVSWYDPAALLMNDGRLATAFENPDLNKYSYEVGIEASNLKKLVLTTQKFIDTLEAGVLETQKISTNSLHIATEDITIGARTLREYISTIVNEILDKRLAEERKTKIVIVSPINEDENSQIEVDSPSSSPSAEIISPTRASTVTPTPEAQPNLSASNSANITNIINIYNNASTSAELASESAELDTPTASISAEQNLVTPSPSPQPVLPVDSSRTANNLSVSAEEILNSNKLLSSNPADIATFSAELSYIPNLTSNFASATFDVARFNQGLIALGPTSLAETSISGQLSIGQSLKISESSINTIGTDLNLQPLRQGNLSIMGGLVNVDMAGNLTVEGNAIFAKDVKVNGKLAANIIVPVPGQDLILGLDDQEGKSKVEVRNSSGNGILSVNQLGDIISSGSAQFRNFKIVRGAQADTSFTETVASGSAGTASITANEVERTIISPFVTENSLIYLTAVSDTNGLTPYIARQTAAIEKGDTRLPAGRQGSFTIQIPQSATADIKLNWWIIN